MAFFIVDSGILPSTVIPLYVCLGDTIEQEEPFATLGVMWQLGNTEDAKVNRAQILTAAKNQKVPLVKLCKTLHVKWADLCEWVNNSTIQIFITKDKKGTGEHPHAWSDEFKNNAKALIEMLEMPADVEIRL